MTAFRSIVTAFAMFSRIPTPKTEWDDANMRYVLAALPLVGVAVGAAVWAWGWLAAVLAFGPLLRGAGFALFPLLLTGGIHMDGFSDTTDALASHGTPERKRAILKDPHLGAFAAIAIAAYLLLFSALAAELSADRRTMACLALVFMLSRAVTGLGALLLPSASDSGLGKLFRDAAARRTSLVLLAAVYAAVAAAMIATAHWSGAAAVAASLLALLWYRRIALKHFGGTSGDLSGWVLQVCELLALAAMVAAQAVISR